MAARRANNGSKKGSGKGLMGQEGRRRKEEEVMVNQTREGRVNQTREVMVNQTREGRVKVAQQTLAILDSGSFTTPTDITVDIREELSQCCSQVEDSTMKNHRK